MDPASACVCCLLGLCTLFACVDHMRWECDGCLVCASVLGVQCLSMRCTFALGLRCRAVCSARGECAARSSQHLHCQGKLLVIDFGSAAAMGKTSAARPAFAVLLACSRSRNAQPSCFLFRGFVDRARCV
eukprot:2991605-Rhodomonas_salina.1